MNLEAILSNLLIVRVMIGLVFFFVYYGLVFGGYKVLDYFFGYKVANLYFKVTGFPLIAFFWTLEKIKEGFTWPWCYRNRRLLKEIFGVPRAKDLDYDDRKAAQREIDTKLGHLAHYLQRAFDRQLEARNEHKLVPELMANDYVKERKKAFWDAWAIAKKEGYQVKPQYSDYL